MALLDYSFKLSRGHVPSPSESIETELFEFHKEEWDSRYMSKTQEIKISERSQLGVGAYSYQANHPPLAFIVFALFRKIFLILHLPLMFQLKLFRIISLLTIAGGLLSIYSGLIRIKNWKIYYFYPLLLFALLAQDMFFSVNIDAFSFLFGSLILNRMMTLFQNPESIRLWTGLSVAVSLGLWAKFTNAYFFLLWPLLTFFLWREERTGQLLKRSLFFFVLTLIISSPWYILNQFRFGTPFATNLGEASSLWPVYPHGPVSFESFFLFLRAFTRTFFRGELLWNGESFDVYQGITRELLLTIIPLILAAAGLIFSLKLFKSTQLREHQFFISSSFLIGGVLLLGYFFVGHVPLYHARYVMGGFYVLLFSMVYGGVRMFRSERAAFFGLGAYLFVQNILYASLLLGKVI